MVINITDIIYCNHRIAATLCTLETLFFLAYSCKYPAQRYSIIMIVIFENLCSLYVVKAYSAGTYRVFSCHNIG